MIVDLRIYTIKPGRMNEFVKLYEDHGWPLQKQYLGNCLGWYTVIEGGLNRVVHLWGYSDQGDRERRRAAMAADPGWGVYLTKSRELDALVSQETSIVKPTGFFEAHQPG